MTVSQLLLYLLVTAVGHANVIYRDNSYENLLVAISPDVPQGDNGEEIIDNIKVTADLKSKLKIK